MVVARQVPRRKRVVLGRVVVVRARQRSEALVAWKDTRSTLEELAR
jgi:hypothetical protein